MFFFLSYNISFSLFFNVKAIVIEEQSWSYLTFTSMDKEI